MALISFLSLMDDKNHKLLTIRMHIHIWQPMHTSFHMYTRAHQLTIVTKKNLEKFIHVLSIVLYLVVKSSRQIHYILAITKKNLTVLRL